MFILTVETEDKKKLDRIVEFVKSLRGCNFSIEEVTETEEIGESPTVGEPLIVSKMSSHVEVIAAQVVPRHLRDDTPYEIYAFVRGKEVYVGKTSIGADKRMQQHIDAAKKTQDEFLLWLVEGMKDGSLERGVVATCNGLSEAGRLEKGYTKSAEKAGFRVLNKTNKLKEIETIQVTNLKLPPPVE